MSAQKKGLAGRIQERGADRAAASTSKGAEAEASTSGDEAREYRPKGTVRTVRTRPVRLSVDLAPQPYRQLTALLAELAESLGVARVSQVEVMRILVDRLTEDRAMQEYVLQRLAENQDE